MVRKIVGLAFAASVSLLSTAVAYAGEPAEAPVATIEALYAADAPFIKETGLGIMNDKKSLARFLSKDLNRQMAADIKRANKKGVPPNIDGDPFVDSQEGGAKDFKIKLLSSSADKASVEADFDRGAGDRVVATFSMILEQNAWRIDDISYQRSDGSKNTLRNELKGR
jgi:Protein of unknown function (DUF3828)